MSIKTTRFTERPQNSPLNTTLSNTPIFPIFSLVSHSHIMSYYAHSLHPDTAYRGTTTCPPGGPISAGAPYSLARSKLSHSKSHATLSSRRSGGTSSHTPSYASSGASSDHLFSRSAGSPPTPYPLPFPNVKAPSHAPSNRTRMDPTAVVPPPPGSGFYAGVAKTYAMPLPDAAARSRPPSRQGASSVAPSTHARGRSPEPTVYRSSPGAPSSRAPSSTRAPSNIGRSDSRPPSAHRAPQVLSRSVSTPRLRAPSSSGRPDHRPAMAYHIDLHRSSSRQTLSVPGAAPSYIHVLTAQPQGTTITVIPPMPSRTNSAAPPPLSRTTPSYRAPSIAPSSKPPSGVAPSQRSRTSSTTQSGRQPPFQGSSPAPYLVPAATPSAPNGAEDTAMRIPVHLRGAVFKLQFSSIHTLGDGVAFNEGAHGQVMHLSSSIGDFMENKFRHIHTGLLHIKWPGSEKQPWSRKLAFRNPDETLVTLGQLAYEVTFLFRMFIKDYPDKIDYNNIRILSIWTPLEGNGEYWEIETITAAPQDSQPMQVSPLSRQPSRFNMRG
ncbi:hypothetical protein PLICRDRAFT_90547 [Plicaturopsis crispa FD-325 SS-3]|nr:hypothetical protein PLICRDRAFT_90547 [Plicaturopsis crispa FD-325 SS-3]